MNDSISMPAPSLSSIVKFPHQQTKAQFACVTASTNVQQETENECEPFFIDLRKLPPSQIDHLRSTGILTKEDDNQGESSLDICLLYDKHEAYLSQIWSFDQPSLKSHFVSLDASRTWMIYWTLHACDLLNRLPSEERCERIVETLRLCWSSCASLTLSRSVVESDGLLTKIAADPSSVAESSSSSDVVTFLHAGGFAGGPGQMPHAATNYAAILALCILASVTDSALALLREIRLSIYVWLVSLQDKNGGYRMHHDGEIDVRASYCILSISQLLHLIPSSPPSSSSSSPNDSILCHPRVVHYLASCQTFEGGFGGEPFAEAHGGYTFCATAAVYILQGPFLKKYVDVEGLLGWLARRQMSFEGGFNGRANKLVDGCYSFWQGGAIAIVSQVILEQRTRKGRNAALGADPWLQDDSSDEASSSSAATATDGLLFDEGMLERYILLCAQDIHGGLRDKPSKARDFYHSCYNLSGLSVAQHWSASHRTAVLDEETTTTATPAFGHAQLSLVAKTHPVYNIRVERVRYILECFREE